MRCHEAREFFSPYLDGELAREEIEVLRQHLEGCPACRGELARWRELSLALQGLKAPVAAPPGFAAAVAARVAARQQAAPWRGVRRWVAAAAAVVLLAAGSIGYAARGLWQHLPAPVATVQPDGGLRAGGGDNTGNPTPGIQQPGVQPPGVNLPPGADLPPGNENNPPAPEDSQQPERGNQAGQTASPVTKPGNNGQDTAAPGGSRPVAPDQQPTQVASGGEYTARTFLNSSHQVTSTMLKLQVADTVGARAKALELAASYGAAAQIIADQDNGQVKRLICQFKVAEGQAAGLLAGLSQLGQVTARNTSRQDLAEQFSATLEQYQAKVAQANAATDPEEKEKLLKEVRALEQQLSTWEQETKQQTIILWLETK